MSPAADSHATFLTVDEAAERLGLTRLRVREAVARGLLPARRDNEGMMRIDLPEGLRVAADADADLDPQAILTFLFDDIEELEVTLAAERAQTARLLALVERQDAALQQADTALAHQTGQLNQMSSLLDRALGHLEASDTKAAHLSGLTDRSLSALNAAVERAEMSQAQSEKLASLLDTAMSLAEDSQGVQPVADRAMALLGDALAKAEAAQMQATRAEAAATTATADLTATHQKLTDREAALDTALRLSERAAELADQQTTPRRKGFWAWVLGR